ncbi:MAG: hypothetical protein GTO37_00570, partial [Planctomycetales bacterium]|nr:hypothetical protein [Planctomycetales bacterium]
MKLFTYFQYLWSARPAGWFVLSMAVPVLTGLAAPAGAAPPKDWSQIPVKEIKLFYPGQSSYEWL